MNRKKESVIKNETNLFDSVGFDFLNDHQSLRPGKKHLLIGTTGTGKSTLTRSVAFNIAKQNKIFWYSSEESLEDMKYAVTKNGISKKVLENIEFRDERQAQKEAGNDSMKFLEWLAREFIESRSTVLFFDNITTTVFYEGQKFDKQTEFFNQLSELMVKLNRPIFMIAHTDSKTKDLQSELFTANDIRGQKIIPNKCEYIYAYQLITYTQKRKDDKFVINFSEMGEKKLGFVRTLKARLHDSGGNIYKLKYDDKKRSYDKDKKSCL